MKRWIPVFLCLLLPAAAASAQTTMEWMVLSVQWGGATSHGDIRVSGLPAVMRTRNKQYRRVLLQQGSAKSHTEPGERVNRPEFGAGKKKEPRPLAARRRHRPIHMKKSVDQATPFLRRVQSTRRVLPRVVLKARDRSSQLRTIVLTNVMITSHSTQKGKGGGDVAMEELTLSCEGIHLE